MNPGLTYLLRMGPPALWRKLRRRFTGKKGPLLLVGVLLLVVLVIGPQILIFLVDREPAKIQAKADALRTFGPAALLLMLVVFSSKGGLYFKPAEVQFLFPAPIGRRELLLYNVLSKLRVQVLSGLWISIFVLTHTDRWYAALVAPILFLALLQFTAQTSGLLLCAIGERIARPLRRIGLLAIGVFFVVGGAIQWSGAPADASLWDTARALVDLPAVRFLSWLTRPFLEVYLAGSVGSLLFWSTICVAVLAVELGCMMFFDVAYAEGAVAQAQKMQQALRRMRSGGGALAAATPSSGRGRIRIPWLPFWRGAGPIAWRQTQELTRNYRGALTIGLIMFLWIGTSVFRHDATVPLVMILVATPLMTMHLAYDFRRDLDRMTILKSLPLSTTAIAAGQMIPTTLLLCTWEMIGVVAVSLVTGQVSHELLAGLMLVLLPLNWVVVTVDNIIFLLLPYRISGQEPGQFRFMGRLMMVTFLKMMVLLIVGGLATLAGFLTWRFAGHSFVLAGATVAALLSLAAVPLTRAVGAAFQAFDVSRDLES